MYCEKFLTAKFAKAVNKGTKVFDWERIRKSYPEDKCHLRRQQISFGLKGVKNKIVKV